jgi:hypothetical protein
MGTLYTSAETHYERAMDHGATLAAHQVELTYETAVEIDGEWYDAVAVVEGSGDGSYEITAVDLSERGLYGSEHPMFLDLVAQITERSGRRIEDAVLDAAEEAEGW